MTSGPAFQQSQQAYAQAVGTASTGRNLIMTRNPNSNDVNYKIGTFWQNTSNQSLWYLNSQSSPGAILQSNWVMIDAASGGIEEIDTDSGTATPSSGVVNVIGGPGITTSGSGDTVTISLSGGGTGIDSIDVQTGTSPVVPDGTGLVTINGAVVAAGTNPVRSDGTGPNTLAIEVQTSQAIAAPDATKIGLSNYDSTNFSVDSTGFVASEPITVNSGPGISISGSPVNLGGTITISADNAGMLWTVVTTSQNLSDNQGFFSNGSGELTFTLPGSSTVGDTFEIVDMSGNGWRVAQNSGQQIFLGISSTTIGVAGSITSTAIGDWIQLTCNVANTSWIANAKQGGGFSIV